MKTEGRRPRDSGNRLEFCCLEPTPPGLPAAGGQGLPLEPSESPALWTPGVIQVSRFQKCESDTQVALGPGKPTRPAKPCRSPELPPNCSCPDLPWFARGLDLSLAHVLSVTHVQALEKG